MENKIREKIIYWLFGEIQFNTRWKILMWLFQTSIAVILLYYVVFDHTFIEGHKCKMIEPTIDALQRGELAICNPSTPRMFLVNFTNVSSYLNVSNPT
jgi:hypothetical protein